jgi:methylmalonyl-CoA mutase cobalamin-binding domain/chain
MGASELLDRLRTAVFEGKDTDAATAAGQGLDAGLTPMVLIKQAINRGMDDVGSAFEQGQAFLPELILAGDAARAALDLILPRIADGDLGRAIPGTVVIGSVFGDAHDIGKNIVSALLAADGIRIVDLGINVPPKRFVEAALAEHADIIAMSSVITTSLPYQREVIRTLTDRGHREDFFVIVGGGPVTPEWAARIGADGYGRDARDATALVRELLAERDAGAAAPLPDPVIIGALEHR